MTSDTCRLVSEKYEISVWGPFERGEIGFRYEPRGKTFTSEMLKFINAEWEKQRNAHPWLFNGQLYNLERCSSDGSGICLELSPTDYREYVGTRSDAFLAQFGSSSAVNPLSVGAVISTLDNYCVVGLRGNRVDVDQNTYALVSGSVERHTNVAHDAPDLYHEVLRELGEETGVGENHVDEALLLGFAGVRQTMAVFDVSVMLTRAEFESFQAVDDEFVAFLFIHDRPESIAQFLLEDRGVLVHCGAGLVLHMCRKYGTDWLRSFGYKR